VSGTPCFREGKVTRVQAWLAGRGQTFGSFEDSWFYSDSLNDLPLLERVTHPVAVDPDDTLRAHAEREGCRSCACIRRHDSTPCPISRQ